MLHAPPWRAGVLVHPATAREYDDSDLRITKNGYLVCLLEQPHPPLGEGNLAASRVLDLLKLYFPTPHWSSPMVLFSSAIYQKVIVKS